MQKYAAVVDFTDGGDRLRHEAEEPDKARIEALQKAKLTGREPQTVRWETPDGDRAMSWPDQVITAEGVPAVRE
jgi:hypothetical protein